MKKWITAIFLLVLRAVLNLRGNGKISDYKDSLERIKLLEPSLDGRKSLEKTLAERRSIREYNNEPITIQELSQLLWAAQGITDPRGFRTAPFYGRSLPTRSLRSRW